MNEATVKTQSAPEIRIVDLKLGQRPTELLIESGFVRLEDLTTATAGELRAMNGIGRESMRKIREALKQRGMALKEEDKDDARA
ncbi:DNA-directed RNA polymerase subunit alpha C-terminal domain-containing protein [Caballeronia zhejiangensis]|nr:DNA-directed RNA polymerase subunit alpha C-terminal domain-containing protein [Caballeronia zhejiangensis]